MSAPGTREHFNGCADPGPNAPVDLVLVDAHLLLATRPPEGAPTLADEVERIAGTS